MPKTFDLAASLALPDMPAYLQRVEACMREALAGETSELTGAVLRLTAAKGKRLRPALVIASALLTESEINYAIIQAAAAIELVHIGSLVHDDIIDSASTRWGIPTINAQEGLHYAILGGDILFAKACSLAAEICQPAGVLVSETIVRLCTGEADELATQHSLQRTEAQLEQAVSGKTAALMAAACKMGGICTDAAEKLLQALADFGQNFGMGFQLLDDVLDFISSDSLLGKPAGNDIKEGIYTMPVLLALKGPKRSLVQKSLTAKSSSSPQLAELLLETGSVHQSIERVKVYNRTAEQALVSVFGKQAQHLAQLPQNYLEWALSTLIAPQYKSRLLSY